MGIVNILLQRKKLAATFTAGIIVFGGYTYHTLEDTSRQMTVENGVVKGKVYAQTAIPAGEYQVVDVYSPKYKKNMLRLLNVVTHEGILIHSGSTSEDTAGCLLLGFKQIGEDKIGDSRKAMVQFNQDVRAEIAKGNKIFIEIQGGFPLKIVSTK